ncbi:threonine synthase (plasmid) [Aminobacter sp. SR38]|uniref:threonine synthase n=1 Tax=Aminobacter sp. SR38 TaxID=2774562 RepID=UPI001780BA01|nr:threonine synthase [Aminobacter sp. SR38]QOF75461.1 threonine synthase [Aminobacter sp. SR38]
MRSVIGYSCIRCGAHYPKDMKIDSRGCPICAPVAPANLAPVYGKKSHADSASPAVGSGHQSLWKYSQMLPCSEQHIVTLGEGHTPLIQCSRIGSSLGVADLFVKDESRNPTWSYKDRFSTLAVSIARSQGARVVATASSGNAGASLAAYAARAGMECVVATFAGTASPMLSQIRRHGATVVSLANKVDRWTLLAEAQQRFGWFVTSPFSAPVVGGHPLAIEGYKTIAYEIVEQTSGNVPDWCVMPVCYGDALSGVWAGFKELFDAGSIDRLPKMVAAEVHGSLSAALSEGTDCIAEQELSFTSLAVSIGTARSTYQALRVLRESSGHAITVTNDGLVEMQSSLARTEGIFAELASVTPLMAIKILSERGLVSAGDTVVAVVTAGGLKDLDRSTDPETRYETYGTTEDAWQWLLSRR